MIHNQTAIIQPGTRGTKVGKIVLNIESQKDIQVESCTLLNVEDDPNFEIEPQDSKLRTHLEDWLDKKWRLCLLQCVLRMLLKLELSLIRSSIY